MLNSISDPSSAVYDDIIAGTKEYDEAYWRQFGVMFEFLENRCTGCPVREMCERESCMWDDDEEDEL